MIVLGVILLALIVVAWVYSMYVSWKVAQGVSPMPITAAPFVVEWTRLSRLSRRGWYVATMQAQRALGWSAKHASAAFVKVFPKSAPVFTKRDALTGLTQGPSSFFLKSISTPRKEKRLPRNKKMV